ncbi:MAG TPA: UTP--glucose-1-phosphate uridylyltransferase GalU [Thermoanaerobaculia bacterium]|nr:UTP--glucose-1-phosphate uridylyltransferase GalU [Thermoanaerobaculia bacterium]
MKIRKAVFPAAGLGTRFLPVTKAQPKEMLPLVDKPLIQYVIEEAKAAGIEQILIVTGRGKNSIEDHFDVSYELERVLEEKGKLDLLEQVRAISSLIDVAYVRQKEQLGLGHAILQARDWIGEEPFAVLLGDDIIVGATPAIGQMMKVYEETGGAVIAVQEVPRAETKSYGVIAGEPDGESRWRISDLVEKPPVEKAPSNLAIIGRYVLPPGVFAAIEGTTPGAGGEIQLTDALKNLLRSGVRLTGYRFEGKRYDAGDKLGFLQATVEVALSRSDLGDKFRAYLKTLQL